MIANAERSLRRFAFEKSTELIQRIFENAKNLEGKKGEDALHAMRVATRRLRETWRLFDLSYPPSRLKKQLARVRKLTRTLGLPREMDVNILLLSRFSLPADTPLNMQLAREHLLGKLTQDQRRCRRKMGKRLAKIDLKDLEKGLRALADAGLRGSSHERQQDPNGIPPGDSFLLDLLNEKSVPLRNWNAESVSGLDDTRLHELRISAKKFRYALEITNSLFSNRFELLIQHTQELQNALGRNQDFRMLIKSVRAQQQWLEERNLRGLYEGVGLVLDFLAGKKEENFRELPAFFSQFLATLFSSPQFAPSLAENFSSPGQTETAR
jgi:CHAD domain-containing protein